jgi:hypothetical protein
MQCTISSLQGVTMGGRSVTPKRGRNSPPSQDRQQIRRTQESLEVEQQEAQEDLSYTYKSMDVVISS